MLKETPDSPKPTVREGCAVGLSVVTTNPEDIMGDKIHAALNGDISYLGKSGTGKQAQRKDDNERASCHVLHSSILFR